MYKSLVKIERLDLEIEDHGILVLAGTIKHADGGCSGFPSYPVNAAFIYRILDCLGVSSLRQCSGKACWMLYEEPPQLGKMITSGLLGFAPLFESEGKTFLIKEWQDWSERRMPVMSPHEMRTGKEPQGRA